MKRFFPWVFALCIFSCSSPLVILQYRDFLSGTKASEISYDDVVQKLGDPIIKKEFEKEFVASWVDKESIPPELQLTEDSFGDIHVKYYEEGKIKGKKLIVTFDRTTKRITDWRYKDW
jgi:hypothetical protein